MTVIRPATQQDLPQLAELVRQEMEYQQRLARCFQLVPQVDWARYVSAKLRHSDIEMLVAEQDGYLVGFIEVGVVQPGQRASGRTLRLLALRFLRPWWKKPDRFGFIYDVYVAPALRNQGIATALVQSSVCWFQRQQVAEIQAAIWKGNEVSLSFFHKLGFEPIKLMMSKRL